jgi:hypothetical protein
MTDTNIVDAVVFAQDDGTGVPDGSESYDSAGGFSLLSRYKGDGNYVGEDTNGDATLQFNDVDSTNNEFDVGTGHAYINDSVSIQSGAQTSYDTTLPDDVPYVVVLPNEVTNLSLDSGTNDVWLAVDPTANDDVYIRHGSGLSAPSDPSVKLGTVDASSGATTRGQDNADTTFSSVQTDEQDILSDKDGIGDEDGHLVLNRTGDLSQDGKFIITEAGAETKDVNGAANIRIYRAGGSLLQSNNLLWDGANSQYNLEDSNLEASLIEIGQEGVQSYIYNKDTSSLDKAFTVSTNHYGTTGVINGYHLVVSDQDNSEETVDLVGISPHLQTIGAGADSSSAAIGRYSDDSNGPILAFHKSRGAVGSNAPVNEGDEIGRVLGIVSTDTNENKIATEIKSVTDAPVSKDDSPGRIEVRTTPDGSQFPTEAFRVDSSQRVILGGTSTEPIIGQNASAQVLGDNAGTAMATVQRYDGGGAARPAFVTLGRSRGSSLGANTALQEDDWVGSIEMIGDDGSGLGTRGAQITSKVDGSVSSDTVPQRVEFATPDPTGSVSESFRIDSDQFLDFRTNVAESADGMNKDPESASEDAFITVKLNGTTYEIPAYATA